MATSEITLRITIEHPDGTNLPFDSAHLAAEVGEHVADLIEDPSKVDREIRVAPGRTQYVPLIMAEGEVRTFLQSAFFTTFEARHAEA